MCWAKSVNVQHNDNLSMLPKCVADESKFWKSADSDILTVHNQNTQACDVKAWFILFCVVYGNYKNL